MSFKTKIMGIEEEVEINYKDFNTYGDIVIPSNVKGNKKDNLFGYPF